MTHSAAFRGSRSISARTHALTLTLTLTLTLIANAPRVFAQDQSSESKSAETRPTQTPEPQQYRTFYLAATTQQEANDVTTDLRNLLPRAKIFFVASQNALSIRGSADDLELAQRIISDIDRPAKTFRLTFTMNTSDAANPSGPRRVSVVVQVGGKSEVKLGRKVPIVTGSFDSDTSKANTEVQYLDVGLGIQAWLDRSGDGLRLRTKVEQSSVAEEKSNVGIQDPVLHQTVLDVQSSLVEGKPLTLGAFDSSDSGKVGVEVLAEQVK